MIPNPENIVSVYIVVMMVSASVNVSFPFAAKISDRDNQNIALFDILTQSILNRKGSLHRRKASPQFKALFARALSSQRCQR